MTLDLAQPLTSQIRKLSLIGRGRQRRHRCPWEKDKKQGSPPMAPTPCPSIALGNGAKCIFLRPSPNLPHRHSWAGGWVGGGLEMDTWPHHCGCDIHWLWEELRVEGLGMGADRPGFKSPPCCSLALHICQLKSQASVSSAIRARRAARASWDGAQRHTRAQDLVPGHSLCHLCAGGCWA